MATLRAESPRNRVGTEASGAGRGPTAALASFVLGGSVADVPASEIIYRGLAGYAVARAAALGEALDSSVKTARIAMAARHLVAKRDAIRLLRAWSEAGLEALIFKGFALAEFVYPDPTWRFYSDVDVALRAPADGSWTELTARAAAIASDQGFKVHGRPEFSDDFDSLHGTSYVGPTILHLVHKTTKTNIDVHSRVVHNSHDESHNVAKQGMITEAVWRDSQKVSLAGVPIRVPSAVDSAVVGLILNRTWSTDSSSLRPQDYLDLAALTTSSGVDRGTLESRARELGCSTTLRFFLRRCNPATRTLVLTQPNAVTRFLFDLLLTPEHGNRALQFRLHELRRLPARGWRTLGELPNVSMHLRKWRSGPPDVWPAELLPDGTSTIDRDTWRFTQFALRRAFQLCGVLHPERRHDLAQAALLYALRKRGFPVKRVDASAVDGNHESVLTVHGKTLRPTALGFKR